MQSTMRALLHQVIDYAGLFPPAKLPLDAALRQYLRERKFSSHRWMLARFVCPTTQLQELGKDHTDGTLLQVVALGRTSAQPVNFLDNLHADLDLIEDFRASWDSADVIDILETALPKQATIAQLQAQLANVAELLAEAGVTGFLEVPMSPSWEGDVADLSQLLGDMRRTQPQAKLGMKLRCGGVTAEAFPSDARVAHFITQCRRAELPWKATAGLHHPLRQWDDTLQVWHHGFLNVFAAGIFARVHGLSEAELTHILADRDGECFRYEDERFTWRDWSADAGEIAEARRHFATAFGSCSFDEPCSDLTAMGLLDVELAGRD